MKKVVVAIMIFAFAISANAQKVKLEEGNLDFLKGQKILKVEFTYDENMKIGKKDADDYITSKVKSKNKKHPGAGDEWKEKFLADREESYEPHFLKMFNFIYNKLGVSISPNAPGAEYVMIVNTTFIEPGFDIGIQSKRAMANMDVYFTPLDDEDEKLAKISIAKAPGDAILGSSYVAADRIGGCYESAAGELAGFLHKKKAFYE